MIDTFESHFAAERGHHEAVIRDIDGPSVFTVWGLKPDVFLSSGRWSITLTPDMARTIGQKLIAAASAADGACGEASA